LKEFENLLSFQESLAKQMANVSIKGEGSALMTRKKFFNSKGNPNSSTSHHLPKATRARVEYVVSRLTLPLIRRFFKCYHCGKIGNIKRFCRAKIQGSNVADKTVEEEDLGNAL